MEDDRKKYLMKRRRYGYGWVPTTWQGWLIIILQIAIVFAAASALPVKPAQPTAEELTRFLVIAGLAVVNLMLISTHVGPKPKWRWGKKPGDNPDEDF